MAKNPKDNQTESDVTATFTDIGYKDTDADVKKLLKKLLGSKSLKTVKDRSILLMLHDPLSRRDFLDAESLKLPDAYVGGFLVLGPFGVDDLYNKVKAGLLMKEDRLQHSGSRWKMVAESYPEWVVFLRSGDELGGRSEFTQSLTMTEEQTRTDMAIDAPPGIDSGLELEDFMVADFGKVEKTPAELPPVVDDEIEKDLVLDMDDIAVKESLTPRMAPARRDAARHRAQTSNKINPVPFVLGIGIIIGVGFWYSKKAGNAIQDAKSPEYTGYVAEAQIRDRLEWADKVRPLKPDSWYVDDDPLMKKIRPILRAYEAGVHALSRQDEYLLRRLASPASASWKVRKIASNQLAVYLLSRSKTQEAKAVLRPILQADSSDFITLVNNAIIDLSELNLQQARDSLKVSLRMNQSLQWVSLSLLGYLEGLDGRWEESSKYFQDALNRNQNNPFISGLWLKVLTRQNMGSNFQIQKLVDDALWADPDTLIDSPLPAPLAGGVIQSEALEGIVKGVEQLGSKVSKGKLLFARWLQGRVVSFSALTSPLSEVAQVLSLEESLQSQALYAYALQRKGQSDRASEVLSKVLPLVEKEQMNSSWLWTFAGDVQAERSQIDQAILYYQAALNKNSYDHAAVHGLGLMLRERGQYDVAAQKIQESMNIRPHFIPGQLRISRFEWQALLGVQ